MIKKMEESKIIDNFRSLIKKQKITQNFNDDIAKIAIKPNEELVISKDLFIEDVHFLKSDGAFAIASKLLLSNISDISSSGAKPLYYHLGFTKNNKIDQKFLDEFIKGLDSVQNKYNISLIGGDISNCEKLFFSITIYGTIAKNRNLSCLNAKNNDDIYITQNIGDSYLGLTLKSKNKPNPEEEKLIHKHLFPEPKVKLAQKLVLKNLSKCATDISDGVFKDLNKICQASKVSANIFLKKIPLSSEAKNFLRQNPQINKLDLFSAGEDYELIFCASKKNKKEIQKLATSLKVKITQIGEFSDKKPHEINLFDKNSKKITLTKFGYEH